MPLISVDKAPVTQRVLGILRRREQKGWGMGAGVALSTVVDRAGLQHSLT